MQVLRVVSVALWAAVAAAHSAAAQPLSQIDGPREFPPASFQGAQFVDSSGCVFIRAGLGGQITWVPRVGKDRKLVCGYKPTFASATPEPQTATAKPETTMTEAAPRAKPAMKPKPKPRPASASTAASKVIVSQPATQTVRQPASAAKIPVRHVRLVRVGAIHATETYCSLQSPQAQRYLLSDGRRVTQCSSKAVKDPVGYLNALGADGLSVEAGRPTKAQIKHALKADAGRYRVVWSTGELNAAGKSAVSQPRPMLAKAAAPSARVPHDARYVQVGAYSRPDNARRSISKLKALDLPVATARDRKGKMTLNTVLAGPFDDAGALAAALATVRRNGFADAFPRR